MIEQMATGPGARMETLHRAYDLLLDLCQQLEDIADSLPDRVDRRACSALAAQLAAALPSAHAEEERLLLPFLAISEWPEFQHLARRLRQEHSLDAAAAMEMENTLQALASGTSSLSAEAIGYQLRSFFESLRRHVGTEKDVLALLENPATLQGARR